MTARPVAPSNDRLLIVVLLFGFVIVGMAWRSGVTEIPLSPNGLSQAPLEVTRIVTVTETSTPGLTSTARIVVVTMTPEPTPVDPWCSPELKGGTTCWAQPQPRTATVIPECPPNPTYQFLCVKPFDGTEAEEVSK
jgi:hypothetical protein